MEAKVKLHLKSDGFSVSRTGAAGVEESDTVDYGDVAELVCGDGKRYLAFVDLDEDDQTAGPVTEYWAYEAVGLDDEKGEVEFVDEAPEVVDVKPMHEQFHEAATEAALESNQSEEKETQQS